MNPFVSVLMTAYNRQQYIAEAIESVLASNYTNFELIIVDDCSKDNTVQIAKSYAEKNNRIRLYINEKNLGDYPNRNRAASYAKGEYIMYCDSDDTLYHDTISKVVELINQFPGVNFFSFTPLQNKEPLYLLPKDAIRKHFFETPFLMYGPVSMVISKNYFNQIGGFPEMYGPANDMYFHLKVASDGGVLAIPFPLGNYRRHEGQEINNTYGYLYNNYIYYRDALNELNLPLDLEQIAFLQIKNKRRFVTNLSRYFFTTFNYKKTKAAISEAHFGIKDVLQGIFH